MSQGVSTHNVIWNMCNVGRSDREDNVALSKNRT